MIFYFNLGLIVIIGGKTVQYKECITDQTCFTLIVKFDGNKNSSLNEARDSCSQIGSTLAEITSNEIQNYTSQFLKSASSVIANVSQKNVLVNAMRHDNGTWFWVNGNEAGETMRRIDQPYLLRTGLKT